MGPGLSRDCAALRRRCGGQLMKLRLGVNDVPYAHEHGMTTGDVAEILEDKYSVMGTFVEFHGQDIADDLTNAIGGTLESLLMGSPPPANAFAEAESSIEQRFRHFLDAGEMDYKVAGVPTQAALKGVNHRLKHPYKKSNPVRKSFIDSGEYQASMAAVVDDTE